MKTQILLLLLSISIVFCFAMPVKISSWKIDEDLKYLNGINISIDYVNRETNTIIVYVRDDNEFSKLSAHGFSAEKMPYEAQDYARALWEETKDSDNPMRAYYSHDEYLAFMQQIATQYPSICELVQIGSSGQNRPILFMKISDNVGLAENEPEFRYTSSIHGDEVVGYDLLIRLIQLLTSQYGQDNRITNLVNNTEIWINPMSNPDGFVLNQRYNAAGIDLNRNFPMPTGEQHPDGNAWGVENIALMNFFEDRNFVLSINFHGGALVMNYPWDYTYTLATDDALLQQASLTYSIHNLPMYNSSEFTHGITNGAAWYVITGSLQDYTYGYTSGIDITCEVSTNKWPPASQLDTFWSQNQESLLSYMEFVHRGVNGIVNSSSGSPLYANISVQGNDKIVSTDSEVGDYHRLLLPGNYIITAAAEGYIPQSQNITVPLSGATTHNFTLAPAQMMSFTGYVYNLQGEAISGASIRISNSQIEPLTMVSNAAGSFTLPAIYEGDYDLLITSDAYAYFSQSISLRTNQASAVFILGQPLFMDSFDSGLTNWTVQSPWAIVSQQGNNVLTDSPSGNYTNNLNRSATLTNAINLQGVQNPSLSFRCKYELESGYDFVHVEVSLNGSNWTGLSSLTGTQSDWTDIHLSLAAYENQNLFLRFRLRTDGSETSDGIYLDDVQISGQSASTIVYGDIDANWIINSIDAQHILAYTVGLDPIPAIDALPWDLNRITAADLNADDMLNSLDAYLALSYSEGTQPPVLSGETLSPPIPQVIFSESDGLLQITFDHPEQVLAFDLFIEPETATSLIQVNWGNGTLDALKAENRDALRLGYVKSTGAAFDNLSLGFDTESTLNIELCINGVLQDYVVNTTANVDEHNPPTQLMTLWQNHPNPFNPETTIKFYLPQSSTTELKVYNTRGQLVKTLLSKQMSKGNHTALWNGKDDNGKDVSSGIYMYRLSALGKSETKRMILVK